MSGAARGEGLLCGDLNNRPERKVTMGSFRADNNATPRSAWCQEQTVEGLLHSGHSDEDYRRQESMFDDGNSYTSSFDDAWSS